MLNILIKSFWVLLILSTILAIAMTIPDIAVYLRIMQLAGGGYYGYPGTLTISASTISFLFTNLWWILLLFVPIVWYRNNHLLRGISISIAAFAILFFIPPLIIKFQTNVMLANAQIKTSKTASNLSVNSITIPSQGCDDLCERLLNGNTVTTVRTSKSKNRKMRHLLYKRVAIQECKTLDPLFDNKNLCIVAYPHDGQKSDLLIERKFDGSGAIKRKIIGFTPQIFMKKSIAIKEQKQQNIVATGAMVRWIEPTGYIPLIANTGFDGNGIHGGGLVPPQRKQKSSPIEAVTLLKEIGIDLAPSRVSRAKNTKKYRTRQKVIRAYAPYDSALANSIHKLNDLEDEIVYWEGYWRISK